MHATTINRLELAVLGNIFPLDRWQPITVLAGLASLKVDAFADVLPWNFPNHADVTAVAEERHHASSALKSFCIPFCMVCISTKLKRRWMMTGNTFKLKTGTMAILSEGDHRSVILIPATAQVILVGGDIKRDTFVKIRYQAKVLLMLSEDLRCGISLVSGHSRS
jgi:hypothetical protein